jgi:hypothetical protein
MHYEIRLITPTATIEHRLHATNRADAVFSFFATLAGPSHAYIFTDGYASLVCREVNEVNEFGIAIDPPALGDEAVAA